MIKPKPAALQLGPVTLTTKFDAETLRLAILLWGDFGVGKTTFAATAPGRKLLLGVDPDAVAAVANRDDIVLADLVGLENQKFFLQMQNENPLGLDDYLGQHPDIHTVILDSATALRDRALHQSVDRGVGRSAKFTPTIEEPGMSAYGGRNQIVLEVISGLLRVTARHKRHIIVTAHEADPEKDRDGVVQFITMNLGGQLYTGVGYRFSEIWWLFQSSTGEKRRGLAIRPTRLHRPMKTRMFRDDGPPEFYINYDATKPDAAQKDTIASWHNQWTKTRNKIPIPK